jgi:ADP-ribose pyrophosphatase
MPGLEWELLSSRYEIDEAWFRLRSNSYRTPGGLTIEPYRLIEYRDWVNAVALTPSNDVILVRQYRPGIGRVILELPGGAMDAEDVSPQEAIRRELLEETGYGGGEFVLLGSLSPNPASHNNLVHSFLVCNVEKLADPRPDEAEHLEIVLMPLDQLIELARDSGLLQAMQVAALFMALAHLGRVS